MIIFRVLIVCLVTIILNIIASGFSYAHPIQDEQLATNDAGFLFMKIIELTKGQLALVDDEDYAKVAKYKWYAQKGGYTYYASRRDSNSRHIYMHRQILNMTINVTGGIIVDHADGNGLNNQRFNLRKCDHRGNAANQKRKKNNKSGYKGVSWDRVTGNWRSSITVNDKSINLGRFKDKELAGRAYDKAAINYFGAFAYLNFPRGQYQPKDI